MRNCYTLRAKVAYLIILMSRTGLVEIDEPSVARKRGTDKTSPNLNYRIESRLMDAISLSAKTTRCAKVEGGSAKSGCREDPAEPEKELSSPDAWYRHT